MDCFIFKGRLVKHSSNGGQSWTSNVNSSISISFRCMLPRVTSPPMYISNYNPYFTITLFVSLLILTVLVRMLLYEAHTGCQYILHFYQLSV